MFLALKALKVSSDYDFPHLQPLLNMILSMKIAIVLANETILL